MAKVVHFKGLNGIRAIAAIAVLISHILGVFEDDYWYNYLIVISSIVISTILVAYLSFHFFEKRFILLKDKFSTVKSTA